MVERLTGAGCLDCDAECCRKVAFNLKPAGAMLELLRVHYGTNIEDVRITLRHRCLYLNEDNLCDLWDEDPKQDCRPRLCKEFVCDRMERPEMLFLTVKEIE